MGFRPIPAAISVALALVICFVIPVPEGVTSDAWMLLGMFVGVISAIIGKVMPIGALSILAITLVAVTGVTSETTSGAINDALSSFANPLIWLIGAAIMISRGIIKTGLGERAGYYFIAIWGKKTIGIAYSLAITELMLAPVTPSNTARGGGIIHPLVRSIARTYDSDPEKGTEARMGKFLALVNYHCNPISAAMFVTATAPNPLVVNLVAESTNMDIHLSWGTWAIAMLLPGLVAMAIMPLVIYMMYPPEIKETPNSAEFAFERLKEMGPITRNEYIMLGIFTILLLLWAGIPEMIFGAAWAVNATTTAFIGLSLLLITGVLTWEDIITERSAWDTITWFAALVMMATFLNKLGLITWFSNMLETSIGGLGLHWALAAGLLLIAYLYAHYMFASTTAHITAMFAAFFTAGVALGAPPMLYALLMAAASNIMMTLTHYATGTSPVVFGSGFTTLGEWWKAGFVMSVVNLAVFVVIGGIWWKILGYW